MTTRPGYREALIEMSVVTNAALGAYTIQQEIGRAHPQGLRAVYGVYVLTDREIWAPRSGSSQTVGLAEPPVDVDGFVGMGDAVMRSRRIASLLGVPAAGPA